MQFVSKIQKFQRTFSGKFLIKCGQPCVGRNLFQKINIASDVSEDMKLHVFSSNEKTCNSLKIPPPSSSDEITSPFLPFSGVSLSIPQKNKFPLSPAILRRFCSGKCPGFVWEIVWCFVAISRIIYQRNAGELPGIAPKIIRQLPLDTPEDGRGVCFGSVF